MKRTRNRSVLIVPEPDGSYSVVKGGAVLISGLADRYSALAWARRQGLRPRVVRLATVGGAA